MHYKKCAFTDLPTSRKLDLENKIRIVTGMELSILFYIGTRASNVYGNKRMLAWLIVCKSLSYILMIFFTTI